MLLGGQGYPRFKINACRRVKTTVKRYGRTDKITDQKSCYGLIFLKIREAAGSDVLDGVCPITEGKPVPMRLVQRHAPGRFISGLGGSLSLVSCHCLFSRDLTVAARVINENLAEISEPTPH